jgi:hypothetical protein
MRAQQPRVARVVHAERALPLQAPRVEEHGVVTQRRPDRCGDRGYLVDGNREHHEIRARCCRAASVALVVHHSDAGGGRLRAIHGRRTPCPNVRSTPTQHTRERAADQAEADDGHRALR